MFGYQIRLTRVALWVCLIWIMALFAGGAVYAKMPQPRQQAQAQPTPPTNPNRANEPHPHPTIMPRLVVPRLLTVPDRGPDTTSAALATPIPRPTPIWEEPIGPASNWQFTDNYLILGTDRRAGANDWRTDTIMIVGLDRQQGRAAVFSIPRDLYIDIPNYGYGRINQVDLLGERNPNLADGGPQLISQVISKTFGIQTDHWVRFQMDGFVRVVDAVGGVTVHLDCPFYEPIFNVTTQAWDFFTLSAGDNQLDGDSAYWFVRLRLRESDIGRSARQRQFLWALRDKMLSANLITRFPELWSAFQDSFSTDLSLIQLIELTSFGISLDSDNVRAGGLTLYDLQNYRTEQGAVVLRIADPGRVRAVVNGVWDAPTMASSYRQDLTTCEPLPQGGGWDLEIPNIAAAPAEASVPITDTVADQ